MTNRIAYFNKNGLSCQTEKWRLMYLVELKEEPLKIKMK
jgi:hypothetical protein